MLLWIFVLTVWVIFAVCCYLWDKKQVKWSPMITKASALQENLLDSILVNPQHMDYLSMFNSNVDSDYALNFLQKKGTIQVSTLPSDLSNFARDLYFTSLHSDNWDVSSWNDTYKNTSVETQLWDALFTLHRGEWVNILGLNLANSEAGNIALPLYLLKHVFGMSVSHLTPDGKRWYLPVKNIDDIFALHELGYTFDSIMEDQNIRWYHLAACNFQVPSFPLPPLLNVQYNTPAEFYGNNGWQSVYTGHWFGFLQGIQTVYNGKNILKSKDSDGYFYPATVNRMVGRGKVSFVVPTPMLHTTIQTSTGSLGLTLGPREGIVVNIKQVLLKCWRQIFIYNAGSTNIDLDYANNQLSVSAGDSQSLILLESRLGPTEDFPAKHVIPKIITIPSEENIKTPQSNESLLYVCGPTLE